MGKVFWWSVLIIVVLLMLVIPFGAHASDGPIGMYEVDGVHKNWFSLDDPNAPVILFMNPELEIWAETGVLHISDPKHEIKKIVFEW